ncbi:MAG: AbrB/MazE/SpoVT family DNA-binding domain-containing protein [Bryobacteraceae bacterium]
MIRRTRCSRVSSLAPRTSGISRAIVHPDLIPAIDSFCGPEVPTNDPAETLAPNELVPEHVDRLRRAIGQLRDRLVVTSKGQITVPKEIRDHLPLRAGERLDFQLMPEG